MNVPRALRVSGDALQVEWTDRTTNLSAATLRAACRCGGCRAQQQAGRPPSGNGAMLTAAVPQGAYAVQLIFADGHDRGIYPWDYLHSLC